jgi:hypothetical protein
MRNEAGPVTDPGRWLEDHGPEEGTRDDGVDTYTPACVYLGECGLVL